jgi:hypothetical protein
MSRAWLLILAVGAFGFAALVVLLFIPADPTLEQVRARADPVVDAVHAFQRDHGKPPRSLDELVPKYLPNMPPPLRATSGWSYHTWGTPTAPEFTINVTTRKTRWQYSSDRKTWSGNDTKF